MPVSIPAVQKALKEEGLDGWLLYDFHGSNPIARRLTGLDTGGKMTSRRWFYVIPASACSVINMAYIHTNHQLSPRVAINDPLIASLSVVSPRFIQWFHGNFGYHVEHHIFPSMSVKFAPLK